MHQMLDFSATHDITVDVEVLPASQVQTALDRLARNDVRYRFVLDMAGLRKAAPAALLAVCRTARLGTRKLVTPSGATSFDLQK
jgi:hypothetical protein